MYCVHLCPDPPTLPASRDACHWLSVGGGQVLLVHADCHQCQQAATRLSHPLQNQAVGVTVAAALATYGVVATDTLVDAMMKVAPTWSPAWP